MYRFLLSGKWLGWFLLVCLLAAACSALGMWQLDRRDAVRADIGIVEENYDADPVPYDPALFEAYDPATEWQPVTLTGTYDTAGQRVVRNRPLNGRPGYEVLVPLRLDDGTAVTVNRGWLPIGNDEAGRPDAVPAPPEGEVEVTVRIRPAEPAVDRGAPEGQLASIDLQAYAAELEYPLAAGSYGVMASESPAPAEKPQALAVPERSEGTHLSYAMQWFAFGLLMFVGLGYAAYQEAQNRRWAELGMDEDEEDGMHSVLPRTRPKPQRARKRPTQEEEEDAILDARQALDARQDDEPRQDLDAR